MPVQRPRHTTLASLVTSLLLVAGLILAAPADAGTGADEQLFVQLINQTRAGAGLPPLAVHSELRGEARSWASSMANTGQLAHAPDISRGISAPWTVLGENVGVHGIQDVRQLHDAFVASPSHYANIVDARYGYVGVGVVVTEGGELWTTHRFMATAEAPTTTAPPTTVAPTTAPPTTTAPVTAPPTTTPPTTDPPVTSPPSSASNNSPFDPAPFETAPANTGADPSTTPPPSADDATTSVSPPTSTTTSPDRATPAADGPGRAEPGAAGSDIAEAGPDEQAPAPTGARDLDGVDPDIEPVRAGPGRPDIEAVEQMLVDLIDAGI